MIVLMVYMCSRSFMEILVFARFIWIDLGHNRELLERTSISRIACYGIG